MNMDPPKRYIGVIDIDSFELQIYLQKFPEVKGRPSGVADCTGRIVSLSHEAKLLGISRQMRVREALRICPEAYFFQKPEKYNKPDSSITREASWKITCIMRDECQRRNITVEHVPNDQWYLDLSLYLKRCSDAFLEEDIVYDENEVGRVGFRFDEYCFPAVMEAEGNSYTSQEINKRVDRIERSTRRSKEDLHFYSLAVGGRLLSSLVYMITFKTKFTASAGVAINLLQAKIACDYHKPGAVTILTESGLEKISPKIRITSISGLKSSLGERVVEKLHITTMADLKNVAEGTLLKFFSPSDVEKIYRASRGICSQDIQNKLLSNIVNCAKYNLNVTSGRVLRFHLDNLSEELIDRLSEELERSKRYPTFLQIRWSAFVDTQPDENDRTFSVTFNYVQTLKFFELAQNCFEKIHSHQNFELGVMSITLLKLSAKQFVNCE